MTRYLSNQPFSVGSPGTQQYRDNYDRIFGRKPEPGDEKPETERPAHEDLDTGTCPLCGALPQPFDGSKNCDCPTAENIVCSLCNVEYEDPSRSVVCKVNSERHMGIALHVWAPKLP